MIRSRKDYIFYLGEDRKANFGIAADNQVKNIMGGVKPGLNVYLIPTQAGLISYAGR